MKKLIIFDLDGTLLDTVNDIKRCLNVALSSSGLKTLTYEETLKNLGYGAKALVERATKLDDKERVEKIFKEYVSLQQSCDNSLTVLYDGLDEALTELKNLGYKLAIVSNKPDSVTQIVVKQKLGRFGFDFVTGNRPELFNPKPDKSCVEFCLNTLKIPREDAVFVGDSEVDVQTFINAKVQGVGVTWGFREKELLKEAGCKLFANNATELVSIIKSL